MNGPSFTIEGNLVAKPEVRFTDSGKAVCDFRVAQTPRRKDPTSGKMVDDEAVYMDCVAWGSTAENIGESLHRGDGVLVVGRYRMERWDSPDGPREKPVLTAEAVGASLRFASAKLTKNPRS